MQMLNCSDELPKKCTSKFFMKDVCLFDDSVEFAISCDFHNIIKDAPNPTIRWSVDSTYPEINNSDDVFIKWFDTHFYLIQKWLQNVWVILFELWLFSLFLVEYFDCDSLISREAYGHSNPNIVMYSVLREPATSQFE